MTSIRIKFLTHPGAYNPSNPAVRTPQNTRRSPGPQMIRSKPSQNPNVSTSRPYDRQPKIVPTRAPDKASTLPNHDIAISQSAHYETDCYNINVARVCMAQKMSVPGISLSMGFHNACFTLPCRLACDCAGRCAFACR